MFLAVDCESGQLAGQQQCQHALWLLALLVAGPPQNLPGRAARMVSLPDSVPGSDDYDIMLPPSDSDAPMLPLHSMPPSEADSDAGLILPADVDEGQPWDDNGDFLSALDEDPDDCCDVDSDAGMVMLNENPLRTPGPSDVQGLGRQDLAEYYSQPRVCPKAAAQGKQACLSLDILTGWDFQDEKLRFLSIRLLSLLPIMLLVLSPPCTAFSALQRLWNYKRMSQEAVARQWSHGMVFLTHSMECARVQVQQGRLFAFEHPASATSWGTSVVQEVSKLPGVMKVTFDQCMLGLTSKVTLTPMRKRTTIMTNSAAVVRAFSGRYCDRRHEHQTIQGSEGGARRSVWAQCYPKTMVDLLAGCVA